MELMPPMPLTMNLTCGLLPEDSHGLLQAVPGSMTIGPREAPTSA